ncbi:hypothetical protein AY505_07745 [Corynebacterium belfantii]|nr:hypothetical protein AY505_07745 [Corynebacterium belfantii]
MEEIPDYDWNYKQFRSQDPKHILSFSAVFHDKSIFYKDFSHKAFYINTGLDVFTPPMPEDGVRD